jgi:acyl carrier protein
MRFDAQAWARHMPGIRQSSLLAAFASNAVGGAEASPAPAEPALADRLAAAAGGDERRTVIEAFLVRAVAQVLRLPIAQIESDKPLRAMGLDSLMAVEFRNRLEAAAGVPVPTTLIWNYPTVSKLAPEIAARMGFTFEETGENAAAVEAAPAAAPPAPGAEPADNLESLLNEIESLSEDAARRALAERVADV